jgi:hypothetical protein
MLATWDWSPNYASEEGGLEESMLLFIASVDRLRLGGLSRTVGKYDMDEGTAPPSMMGEVVI